MPVPRASGRVPLARFVRGAMETELAPAELVVAIRIPRFSRAARFGFHKICRKTGEFADAIGVVVHDPERTHVCVAAGGSIGRPLIMRSEMREASWSSKLEQGASHNVPSPLWGRDRVGGMAGRGQTPRPAVSTFAQRCGEGSDPLVVPPIPNPSPHVSGAPSARRGGEPEWRKWGGESGRAFDARPLLAAAAFAGDAYDLALHAAALKRAYDEAFAT